MGVTDDKGHVRLDLPTGFNRAFAGFIELQGTEVHPQILKFSYMIGGPSVQVLTLINRASYKAFGSFLGVDPDPARGILQTRMYGCSAMTTRGVKFAIESKGTDEKTKSCYMDNGLPNFAATETDALGAGISFDVKPDYQNVTATRASDGAVVAHVNTPIRAGFITILMMEPDSL
jgi:hypothetical protein